MTGLEHCSDGTEWERFFIIDDKPVFGVSLHEIFSPWISTLPRSSQLGISTRVCPTFYIITPDTPNIYDYDGVTCNGEYDDEPLDFWNLRLYLRQLHSEQLPVSGWGFMLHFPTRATMYSERLCAMGKNSMARAETLYLVSVCRRLHYFVGSSMEFLYWSANQVLFRTESWVVTQVCLSEMTSAYQLTYLLDL